MVHAAWAATRREATLRTDCNGSSPAAWDRGAARLVGGSLQKPSSSCAVVCARGQGQKCSLRRSTWLGAASMLAPAGSALNVASIAGGVPDHV